MTDRPEGLSAEDIADAYRNAAERTHATPDLFGALAENINHLLDAARDPRPVGEGLREALIQIAGDLDDADYPAIKADRMRNVARDALRAAALADTGPVVDREEIDVERLAQAIFAVEDAKHGSHEWTWERFGKAGRGLIRREAVTLAAEYRRLSTDQPASTEAGEDG